ncbi:hypothetical protein HELRODRAFT_82024 [Helobdella robusta]|uniref:Protein kinase domain-containing protein n=1 Tax=Helobdella robusta TaxID=6412 RepID=T1G4M0_HELRO|nr:hypothetical protein HELRODRAFT_82024 [Helobdella robusta]ESO01285.1 hypothetical protein HELRODRAFT_82024 [Helobdella robusta]
MWIFYELIAIVDAMHKCSIMHGDLKPDNVLIRKFQSPDDLISDRTVMLKLIDFGQGIDMGMYPPGTQFTAKSGRKDLQCIEMKTGKPWSYEHDLYMLAGTLYTVVMGSYMNVARVAGQWKMSIKFKRSSSVFPITLTHN